VRKFPAEPQHYLRWKRSFDFGVAILLLPVVLPLLALCCVVIVVDSPGYPLFTQLRTGTCGRRFRMFKLRTMVRDAEAYKDRLGNLNELSWPDFKIRNDPRVTRAGKFLRKTSLDELPQIFNVLRGDMSLVGPRPTSFSSSTYSTWHTARLDVQSGVTGLWQIEGRNDIDFDERVRLDIAYARHRSFTLDILILLRTIPRVVSGRGAN
jgi:lipopolysaccharide/colanic/teichoic acid biosynthesis glycosyltransferase